MKMTKWIGIVITAGVAVGGAFLVKGQSTNSEQSASVTTPRPGGGRLLARLGKQLDLTSEQTATIRTDLAADKDTLTRLLSSLHEARISLRETIRTPNASEEDIRAAAAKVAGFEADLAVERAKLYGKISLVLTTEQLAKLDELQQRADDMVDGAIVGFGRRLAQ